MEVGSKTPQWNKFLKESGANPQNFQVRVRDFLCLSRDCMPLAPKSALYNSQSVYRFTSSRQETFCHGKNNSFVWFLKLPIRDRNGMSDPVCFVNAFKK